VSSFALFCFLVTEEERDGGEGQTARAWPLHHSYHQSCLVYSMQTGGRKGSLILSNNREQYYTRVGNAGGRGDDRMVDSCTTASK